MQRKPLPSIVPLALTAVAAASFINRYAQWKEETYRRLQANSRVIDTALGPD